MQELDDIALLRHYTEHNSEEAFATLVARHVNKVYSVALRHTRNPHQAAEITQAVFVILANKSRHLGKGVILSGWLYQTARLTAVTQIRSEIRRARREQEAHMQNVLNETEFDAWPQIAPLLDTAMAGLSETDRHAVVLRFFDGKSMDEVGAALGASEDAAKMRLHRAVEKLRRFFTKRGVVLPTAVLTAAISANSVQAVPAVLAKTATAVAFTKGATASGSTLTLIKGALKVMAWTKAKTAVAAGAALILAAGTTTVVVKNSGQKAAVSDKPVTMNYSPADSTPESFKAESIQRVNDSRQWAVAFILFADDHGNELPKKIDEVKKGQYIRGTSLPDSNWEVVSSGNLKSFKAPANTILLQEKKSRQSPNRNFTKVYAFVDGHSELLISPGEDFSAVEKEHGYLTLPPKN